MPPVLNKTNFSKEFCPAEQDRDVEATVQKGAEICYNLRNTLESSKSEVRSFTVYPTPVCKETLAGLVPDQDTMQMNTQLNRVKITNLRSCPNLLEMQSNAVKCKLAKYKHNLAQVGLWGDAGETDYLKATGHTDKGSDELRRRICNLEKQLSECMNRSNDLELSKKISWLLKEVLTHRVALNKIMEKMSDIEVNVHISQEKVAKVDQLEKSLKQMDKQVHKYTLLETEVLSTNSNVESQLARLQCFERRLVDLKSCPKYRQQQLKKFVEELKLVLHESDLHSNIIANMASLKCNDISNSDKTIEALPVFKKHLRSDTCEIEKTNIILTSITQTRLETFHAKPPLLDKPLPKPEHNCKAAIKPTARLNAFRAERCLRKFGIEYPTDTGFSQVKQAEVKKNKKKPPVPKQVDSTHSKNKRRD